MAQIGATEEKLRITVDKMGVTHQMTSLSLKVLVVSDLENRNAIQHGTLYTVIHSNSGLYQFLAVLIRYTIASD